MTIILTVGTSQHMIQFSDRRLSSAGRLIDDHSNKATIFTCRNGRFSVGYTGLARSGSFRTQEWIVDALARCAPPEHSIYETATRLADELKSLFANDRRISGLPASDRRLTIMLSGFVYNEANGKAGCILITNFQDFSLHIDHPEAKEDFTLSTELEKDALEGPLTYVQRVGAWHAMTKQDEITLRALAATGATPSAIISAGVGLIREMSSRPAAMGTIGKEILVTVIPRNLGENIDSTVHHPASQATLAFADQVSSFPENSVAIKEFNIQAVDGLFHPKLGRNERCHCGSNLKYKRCHGK